MLQGTDGRAFTNCLSIVTKREFFYLIFIAGYLRALRREVFTGKNGPLEECHRRKHERSQESYLLCLTEQKGCLEQGVTQTSAQGRGLWFTGLSTAGQSLTFYGYRELTLR